jgi:hypothetical protein
MYLWVPLLMQAAQRAAGDEGAPAMAEPTAEEIREELVPLLLSAFAKRQQQQNRSSKSAAAAAPHNLAAITMLCMQPGYEDRAVDFLSALFAEFQQQVCCRASSRCLAAEVRESWSLLTLLGLYSCLILSSLLWQSMQPT